MSILYLVEYIHRVAQNDDDNGNATVHAWLGVRFRIKQNKNYIERPLESEHLKFMSPRMSHYTCLLSDHDRLFKVGKALGQTSIHCFFFCISNFLHARFRQVFRNQNYYWSRQDYYKSISKPIHDLLPNGKFPLNAMLTQG